MMHDLERLVGIKSCKRFRVYKKHIASNVGSGGVDVLSTPSLIAFMENVSFELLEKHLPKGYTSVGVEVCIRHIAPAKIGDYIDVYAEVKSVKRRKIIFDIKAFYADKLIGEGTHIRYVIKLEEFVRKLDNP